MRGRIRGALTGALVVVVLLLAGCVSVPTSGPVTKVQGQQPPCQNCVNVEVAPPTAGDDPSRIVEGYLRANANYQPNYAVARQFLTRDASEKWSPEDSVTIYTGSPRAAKNNVTFAGRLVGGLDRDHTYSPQSGELNHDFRLTLENDEWRIDNPLPGLMVADYSFTSFYHPYDLYFTVNGTSLVPDPIYLPYLRNPANIASALMKALLSGPSRWLQPAVTTFLPTSTGLSVDSVTITNGVATVPLSDAAVSLPDASRALLAAQVVYTLKQVTGVKGVLLQVGSSPLRVPQSDDATLVVPVDRISTSLDPVPAVTSDQLYAVWDGKVQVVTATADAPTTLALPGPLGQGRYAPDALAVSDTAADLAAVTDGGTVLRRASTTTGEVSTVLSGVSELLRPQFNRLDELWVIGTRAGRQHIWVRSSTGVAEIDPPDTGGQIVAFRISPDGVRLALTVRSAAGVQLGLARIIRTDKIVVDQWHALDTRTRAGSTLTRIGDLTWVDATNMLVLAAAKDAPLAPFRISADGSQITSEGAAVDFDAAQLSVLLRTQTAVVVGRNHQTYRDDGSQWTPFIDNVTTIVYAG